MTGSLPVIVLLPILGALLPELLARRFGIRAARTAAAITLAGFILVIVISPPVFEGEVLAWSAPWIPQAGLAFSLRLGGLNFLFALLALGIGLLVILYAAYYLSENEARGRFFGFLLLFQGAMLGLVLSENLLLMTVFWELTSLSSFLLIGFWRHKAEARQGARLALFVTGAGGLALFAAVLLLGGIAGSFELEDVIAAGDLIRSDARYPLILTLILIAAFTKSAQFPFHFWLPQAMAAPTPVSAYLHSATMVKAGIYLLARFFPVLAGTELWFYTVSVTGLVTMVLGAYLALFQHDLKGLLAYSTVSHLGLITLLLGLGTPLGEIAAVLHIINHAVFKASLFMAAGIIDHETGTRDMRKLSGLFRLMPYTATLAIVAAAAMAGVPLLNGFLSKEMFFTETLHVQWLGGYYWVLSLMATVGGALSVAYSLRFIHDTFFGGPPVQLHETPHRPPRWMRLPVELLVALCIAVGVIPDLVVRPILDLAATTILQQELPPYELAVWHGFTLPLAMSVAALAAGAILYSLRGRIFATHARLFPPVAGKALAELALDGLVRGSRRLYGYIDNGSLQRYVSLLIFTAIAVAIAGWMQPGRMHWPALALPDAVSALGATALAAAALATAMLHRRRLVALIFTGVVGLFASLTFVRFSAPDLALTQILVELVTLILLLLALYFLPPSTPPERTRLRSVRDLGLAVAAGIGTATLCLGILTSENRSGDTFYLEHAKPEGGGQNVVNVILVDFRGYDTLGEIAVLAIAAVVILAMLHRISLVAYGGLMAWQPAEEAHPLPLRVLSRLLLPFALLVSAYLLIRGHNDPGGGFIAGLVTAVALILQYLANGSVTTEGRLRGNLLALAGTGVLLAAGTGAGSWLFGHPFLTSWFGHPRLPLIGEVELATAMLFDVGVFLAVVGTVLVILVRLGRESAVRAEQG